MTEHNTTYHCTSTGVHCHQDNVAAHTFVFYKRTAAERRQLYGNSYHGINAEQNNFEDNRYSTAQYSMYRKCLYGLQELDEKDIKTLSFTEREQLVKNHRATLQLINLSKWKATSDYVRDIFNNAFPRQSPMLIKFLNNTNQIDERDNDQNNENTLKWIGGTTVLINKLFEMRILPANFFNLKPIA